MTQREINRRAFLSRTATVAAGAVAVTALPTWTNAEAAPATPSTRIPRVPDVDVRAAAKADPTETTIAEAITLMRHHQLTAVDLVDSHLDRITKFDSVYQAFNAVTADAARAAAVAADKHPAGVLSGIPLCIKDNYYTAGVTTTANSFIYQSFVPPYDATSVARLKGAGGIVLGKGQMGPLATTRATTPNGTVTTVNAWTPSDPSIDPGGSSTGPACSVAGRMATSSIGTQTGGSIVNPSNQQNLTGLKPTMGRTSIYGVIPLSYTRDHSGPLARDALDAAIMLTIMAGPDPNDPRTLGLPDVPDLITSALPVRRHGSVVLRRLDEDRRATGFPDRREHRSRRTAYGVPRHAGRHPRCHGRPRRLSGRLEPADRHVQQRAPQRARRAVSAVPERGPEAVRCLAAQLAARTVPVRRRVDHRPAGEEPPVARGARRRDGRLRRPLADRAGALRHPRAARIGSADRVHRDRRRPEGAKRHDHRRAAVRGGPPAGGRRRLPGRHGMAHRTAGRSGPARGDSEAHRGAALGGHGRAAPHAGGSRRLSA